MAVDGETPKGWLVVKVLEVAGHNKEDEVVWDPSFDRGFVRGERCPASLPCTSMRP